VGSLPTKQAVFGYLPRMMSGATSGRNRQVRILLPRAEREVMNTAQSCGHERSA
jgi:hypothetical protein